MALDASQGGANVQMHHCDEILSPQDRSKTPSPEQSRAANRNWWLEVTNTTRYTASLSHLNENLSRTVFLQSASGLHRDIKTQTFAPLLTTSMLTPGPSSAPTPKSLQGTRTAPKVSARETMAAAAGNSLLIMANDGNVTGVQQALTAGLDPPVPKRTTRGSTDAGWGGSFWSLHSSPFLSPVTLSFHFLFFPRRHPQPPKKVLPFLLQ